MRGRKKVQLPQSPIFFNKPHIDKTARRLVEAARSLRHLALRVFGGSRGSVLGGREVPENTPRWKKEVVKNLACFRPPPKHLHGAKGQKYLLQGLKKTQISTFYRVPFFDQKSDFFEHTIFDRKSMQRVNTSWPFAVIKFIKLVSPISLQ